MERLIRIFFPRRWWERRSRTIRDGLKSVGSPVRIREPVALSPIGNIAIGSNVVINEQSLLLADGGITIGDNVAISLACTILTSSHLFEGPDWNALPWSETNILSPVNIEDNVWIGINVTILPGVTIHEGAIVGAGSVVTSDVPKCAVVAGNPARVIKTRDVARYEELKSSGAFRIIPTDIDRESLITQ